MIGCQKRTRSLFLTGLAALLAFTPMVTAAGQFGTVPGKYNPGHYITLTHFDDWVEFEKAAQPGVVGFQRRFDWGDLEVSKGQYDFSKVREDLDHAAALGRQFVVLVADKTFDGVNPMPGYLKGSEYVAKNRAGGYTALRWRTEVNNRFTLLLQKLGQEFDMHPAFEGLAVTESALSLNDWVLDNKGYTPWKYRNAILNMLGSAAEAAPHSRVFWYMNYLRSGREYMDDIAKELADKGIVINGPDLLPDSSQLQDITYPIYRKLHGVTPLALSVQFDSYSHKHADPSKPTKYWTMEELYKYGKNELNLHYIFWNNMKWKSPWDSYTVNNAYKVIAKYKSFNGWHWSGDWQDSDNDGLSDSVEKMLGTKVWSKDTDGDGLLDGQEVNELGTDPLTGDTDKGGKNDHTELRQGRNPKKTSDDFGSVPDSDNDGLSNYLEEILGTDPFKRDTDGEGLNDGEEVNIYGTNPLDKNTDRDGINDKIEIVFKGTDPLDPDTDGGGVNDGDEVKRGTNPLKAWDD